MEREMKILTNRFGLAVPAIMGLVMLGGASANAAKSAEECSIDLDVCYRIACKNEGDWCFKECEKTFMSCGRYGGSGKKQESGPDPLKPKGGNVRAPSTGSAKDEPKAPPKVNDTRAPVGGGVKGEPKTPPKVNDTRAPIGGGVFHSTTSGAGTNSGSGSGTILRANGAPAPIQKPNGGNGPSSKSGGGLR